MRYRNCIGLLVLSSFLTSCGVSADDEMKEIATKVPLGVLQEPYSFKRKGEEAAIYTIWHVSPGKDAEVIFISTRYSSSTGWAFSKRGVLCEKGRIRSIGSSDKWETLKDDKAETTYAALVPGSSAYFSAQKACVVSGRSFGA